MIEMMKALRWHGDKNGLSLKLDDIPKPPIRHGWVLVKNAWSGICGSGECEIKDCSSVLNMDFSALTLR